MRNIRTKTPKTPQHEAAPYFQEVQASDEYMESLNEDDGLYQQHRLSEAVLDQIDEARSALVAHVLKNSPTILTDDQRKVFTNFLQGDSSQDELAQHLGWSGHSKVSYHLHGFSNPPGSKKPTRGGAIPALQIWSNSDPKCKELLETIKRLYNTRE